MQCKCKNCGRNYTYDETTGYATDLCGAYCDGRYSAKEELGVLRWRENEIKRITQCPENVTTPHWVQSLLEGANIRFNKQLDEKDAEIAALKEQLQQAAENTFEAFYGS